METDRKLEQADKDLAILLIRDERANMRGGNSWVTTRRAQLDRIIAYLEEA